MNNGKTLPAYDLVEPPERNQISQRREVAGHTYRDMTDASHFNRRYIRPRR